MKGLLIAILVLCVGAVAVWERLPKAAIKYRLTLTASVDGKPTQGSGVIAVEYIKPPDWLLDSPNVDAFVRGEAVMLDVGKRGKLFALLSPGSDSRTGPKFLVPYLWGRNAIISAADVAWLQSLRGSKTVESDQLPFLVRFRDPNDPNSVEQVDPNDLEASFGSGVKLLNATIEITDEPITSGLYNALPWLGRLVKRHATLDGNESLVKPIGAPLAGRLFASDFVR
jgi:hypothetical protein